MKVVHVVAYFAPAFGFGGPPRSVLELCQAQQAAGLDLEVFTTTANRGAPLMARPDGEIVDGVPVLRFPLGRPHAWLGAPSMQPAFASAVRAADVVHLHGLFNRTIWIAGRVLASGARPYVVSPRGMLEPPALAHHAWRKRASWRLVDRGVLARAARWHATSTTEAATLSARPDARPVVVIPNSVEQACASAEARAAARRLAGLAADTPFLLFLGRVHPIKRLDLLADAFTRAAARHPEAVLVVAGPDESGHRARVEPAFAAVADRVRWVGAVSGTAKAGLLAEARALVLCSDSESFGMSVGEALAAGTPAVVTRTCPWREIEDAGAGCWVPQTPAAIAEAIDRLLADSAAAVAMGDRARALAAGKFGQHSVAQRWVSLYREVVETA